MFDAKKTLNKNKNTHREGRSVRTYFNAINGIERSCYNNVEKKIVNHKRNKIIKKHTKQKRICVCWWGGREKRLTFYRLPASLPLANALLSQLTRRTPTQPFRQRHTIKECESRWQREQEQERGSAYVRSKRAQSQGWKATHGPTNWQTTMNLFTSI